MNLMKRLKKFLKSWARVNYEFLARSRRPLITTTNEITPLKAPVSYPHLEKNRELKNLHQRKRAFILCTGPSIAKMDLKILKDEICFSVSNFYKHSDYGLIRPKYHCIPNIFEPQTEETITKWFADMHKSSAFTNYLLGDVQVELVQRKDLLPGSQKYFLRMRLPGEEMAKMSEVDLTKEIPGVQSVPIMCIMAAMYMGFSEVYLLGVDHDALFTHKYDYFFERSSMNSPDPHVNPDGTLKDTRYDVMLQTANLWKQYMDLDILAKKVGLKIYNATPGSYLDVYPRVEFESLFRN